MCRYINTTNSDEHLCEVIFLMSDSYLDKIITDHLYSQKACKVAEFSILKSEGILGFSVACEIEKVANNLKYFPNGMISMNLIDKEIEIGIMKALTFLGNVD